MHAVFSGHYDEELEKWDREREARLKGMGGDAGNDGKDGRDGGLGHGYGAGKTRLVWMFGWMGWRTGRRWPVSSLTYQRSASKKRVSRRIRESKAVNYAEKARMLSEIERVGAWEVLSELERLERGRKG